MENYWRYFSGDNENWGIKLITCGYEQINRNAEYPVKGHPESHLFSWEEGRTLPDYYIIYIPTGGGVFESNTGQVEIKPGDAIIINKEEWHRYKPHKDLGWEEYWLGFKGEYIESYVVKDLFPSNTTHIKPMGYQSDIITLFNHILRLVGTPAKLMEKVLFGSLIQLISHFTIDNSVKIKTNRHEYIVQSSIDFIRQNLTNKIDYKKMSERFNLSYSQFRLTFKKATGYSLNQFLIAERIGLARRLLHNTDMEIGEVAHRVGINSVFYFSKLYKQKTGKSPSHDRRSQMTI
ncbi:helix-turn-helix domain-containing protein [Reichenbachiella sp.]|uniref:helix-turn-helix domain-containing protein n=1 Tax=Reichenbachiella sp. TaxID=2184521 RepID=UPI003B58EB37